MNIEPLLNFEIINNKVIINVINPITSNCEKCYTLNDVEDFCLKEDLNYDDDNYRVLFAEVFQGNVDGSWEVNELTPPIKDITIF